MLVFVAFCTSDIDSFVFYGHCPSSRNPTLVGCGYWDAVAESATGVYFDVEGDVFQQQSDTSRSLAKGETTHMPIEIRKFALREGVQEEDFERFMIEEVFPVVQTVVSMRIGMHRVHHRLLKTEPRKYWWTVELHDEAAGGLSPNEAEVPVGEVQKVGQESIETFPTDIGEALYGQLLSYIRLVRLAHHSGC